MTGSKISTEVSAVEGLATNLIHSNISIPTPAQLSSPEWVAAALNTVVQTAVSFIVIFHPGFTAPTEIQTAIPVAAQIANVLGWIFAMKAHTTKTVSHYSTLSAINTAALANNTVAPIASTPAGSTDNPITATISQTDLAPVVLPSAVTSVVNTPVAAAPIMPSATTETTPIVAAPNA